MMDVEKEEEPVFIFIEDDILEDEKLEEIDSFDPVKFMLIELDSKKWNTKTISLFDS